MTGNSKVSMAMFRGWTIPPPKEPVKSRDELKREREEKVSWLTRHGYLKSERTKAAMLKVRREDFMPSQYRDYAYLEVPFPLPGMEATISCPHSYPLFYEPLGLDEGHRFMEVGLGSGYGAAIAREVVGPEGLVVSIEIDPLTLEFAKNNLEAAGYGDIILLEGDGGLGCQELSPYDSICVTSACPEIPPPLIEQLKIGGRLIAPVTQHGVQNLTLLEKKEGGVRETVITEVLYVSLKGRYGTGKEGGP
jgi:protein-L-isoaspartate(D-aspartate) O-methyltransferase